MPEYSGCQGREGGSDIESEGEEVRIDDREPEAEEHAEDTNGYIIAKYPPYPHTSLSSLIDLFTASDFLTIFTALLEQSPYTSSHAPKPSLSTRLPVFKCFTVRLPSIVVYACPALPSVGIRTGSAAAFDTVLARETGPQERGRSPLRPSSATDPTWAKCRVPCQNCELGCELGSWHFPRQRTKHSESARQPFLSFVPFLASSSCSLL